MKRVVITGMGIYSCLGKNLDEVKESLYKGTSGIVYDEKRKEFGSLLFNGYGRRTRPKGFAH